MLRLSIRTQNELMPAHPQPRNYLQQKVPITVWTASVTWYTRRKLALTKILRNGWLVGWWVGWLVGLFFGVSTLSRSFNTKSNFKQFNLV